MTAKIIDGKAIAREMRAELAAEIARLKKRGVHPGLGVLLVGDDPASCSYVSAKEKACKESGIHSRQIRLPASASISDIRAAVEDLNSDSAIHGVLVQLPLPDTRMEQEILQAVLPEKDVDGFHPVNAGRLVLGLPAPWPCTPHGVIQLLQRSGVKIAGSHVVIVGRSSLVGRPLANLLSMKSEHGNATVTLCHSHTKDIAFHTRQADIVIAAAGRPNLITADMIREGAVVIDVGVNRIADAAAKSGYRLCGDTDFEGLRKKAGALTPVPGGVGPMTITMLMHNTVWAAAGRWNGGGAHG
ncbi:MAG: bifunctional methylenetetrahydrofolate dehydrogenase/methenyltetrahydrofolate cyclohydrolase FolD [Kiritimatiellia bacterium]